MVCTGLASTGVLVQGICTCTRDREKYIVTTIYCSFIFIVSLQYLFIVETSPTINIQYSYYFSLSLTCTVLYMIVPINQRTDGIYCRKSNGLCEWLLLLLVLLLVMMQPY